MSLRKHGASDMLSEFAWHWAYLKKQVPEFGTRCSVEALGSDGNNGQIRVYSDNGLG